MPKIINKVRIKDIKLGVKKMYPELESLEVTPTLNKNIYVPSKYGFDEVTVNAIETEDIRIATSKQEQRFTGIYREVVVDPYRARLQEKTVTPKEYEQVVFADSNFDGLSRVNVGKVEAQIPAETEELTITPTESTQVFEGLYDKVTCLAASLEKPIELPIILNNINGTLQIKLNKKNLFNGTLKSGLFRVSDGKTYDVSNVYVCSETYIDVSGLTDITVSNKGGLSGVYYVLQYDSNKNFLGGKNGNNATSFTCTLATNTKYIRVEMGNSTTPPTVTTLGDFQIEEGTVATSYSPYTKITLINENTATIKLSNLDIVNLETI